MKRGKKTFQITGETIGSEAQPMVLKSCLNEFVISMEHHKRSGLLDQISQNLQLPRKSDSYADIDIITFLYAFFCARVPGGLKGFYEYCRNVGDSLKNQLAATCGRDAWPSSSSVSRYLVRAEKEIVRQFSRWLLVESCVNGSLLKKEGATCFDTEDNPWHIFDFDYQVLAVRHRKLVLSHEYPPPDRLSPAVVAPGYAGRKRGEKQIARGLLSHDGTGLWLGCWASSCNGDICDALGESVHVISDLFHQKEIPLSQALLRIDNAAGHSRCLNIIQQSGIHYLVRLALYKQLYSPIVKQTIANATWQKVTSSGSGPQRFATELGAIRLPLAQGIVDSKLEGVKPVVSRVVVSRYRAEKKRGVGELIDGWVYEMFGTSLSPTAWPAQELVSTYFARAGKENRIAQQNREMNLNYLYCSKNIPGLELVNTIGMWVQNSRTQLGFILEGETLPVLVKEPRTMEDESTPQSKTIESEQRPSQGKQDISEEALKPVATSSSATSGNISSEPTTLPSILAKLSWTDLLETRTGFKWDPINYHLTCMCGVILSYYRIRMNRGKWSILFRAPRRHCSRCPKRSFCSSSKKKNFQKELWVPIPDQIALDILKFSQDNQNLTLVNEIMNHPAQYTPPKRGDPGPLKIRPSTIVATELRRTFIAEVGKIDVFFIIIRPPPPSTIAVKADDIIQHRLRRRKSWEERYKNNQLPGNVTVHVRVSNTPHLALLFQDNEKQVKVA